MCLIGCVTADRCCKNSVGLPEARRRRRRSFGPRRPSVTVRTAVVPAMSKPGRRLWSARAGTLGRQMRSRARHRRIVPRRSSTADKSHDRLHRRLPGRLRHLPIAQSTCRVMMARCHDPSKAPAGSSRVEFCLESGNGAGLASGGPSVAAGVMDRFIIRSYKMIEFANIDLYMRP